MTQNASASSDGTPAFAPLTENDVKAQTDSGSFSRGQAYFRNGHIRETVRRGATIEAQCEGSDVAPYRVWATLPRSDEPIASPLFAACTCPRGGFCKHIVAMLLTWIEHPSRFVEHPPLAELLGERTREDLVALIERMVARHPELERLVELASPVFDAEGTANVVSIDVALFRRQARAAYAQLDFEDDPYSWDGDIPGAEDLFTLLELGQRYLGAKQWANAQAIFAILVEETGDTIVSFPDDEGRLVNAITECDSGLAACLDAQAEIPGSDRLSAEDRERLIVTIYNLWRFDLFELDGIDLVRIGPETLARNVTDTEREIVENWLRKESTDEWTVRQVADFQVRLREATGLDDAGRLEIYREAELWDDVAMILLNRMDKVDEAVAVAARRLKDPRTLMAFANSLIHYGDEYDERAFSLVDDHAWEVEGANPMDDALYQHWLLAHPRHGAGHRDALAWAEKRFKSTPTLDTWLEARHAAEGAGQAGDIWAEPRPQLEAHLRAHNALPLLVDIHLEEGDLPAALKTFAKAEKQRKASGWDLPSWEYEDQDLRLAQAVEQDFPDEAVAIYRERAAAMIHRRQRAAYKMAAEYLERAKELLEHHNRPDDWRILIAEVGATYKNLPALREELDTLDLC